MTSLQPNRHNDSRPSPVADPPPSMASPADTSVELPAYKEKSLNRRASDNSPPPPSSHSTSFEAAPTQVVEPDKPLFSRGRKNVLLTVFALSMFIDILFYSAFFVLTDSVAKDLKILFAQQSWVITSYSVTFSAFLLFWGRVADLYSAKPVFTYGFVWLGILSLIISFLKDKYSFFVLRALAGIAGSCLVPSAYRLITHVFEPQELAYAFTVYGISGSLASVSGMIVAGFIGHIPDDVGQQNQAWRWFFRLMAICILPLAALSLLIVPEGRGHEASSAKNKWRRLDLVGALLMLSFVVLLILGLTLGASYGWRKPGFLVPFLLAWVLLPAFFVWENSLLDTHALIPSKTWRIPNFTLWIVFSLEIYAWWSCNLLPMTEIYLTVRGERPIVAAVRMLPQGLSSLALAVVLIVFPKLSANPRWPVTIGMLFAMVGYALFAQPRHWSNEEYWRYIFPGMVVGSAGDMAVMTGANVGVMMSVPPEMSGVAGAMLQVGFQVGVAIGLSIQAGLLTVQPGGLSNTANIHAAFYFQMGWVILWLLMFLTFFRMPKQSVSSEEDGAEQGPPTVVAEIPK